MKQGVPAQEDRVSTLASGLRLDLVIAVCALLISTLATGASWWQARVLETQTHVLEEQLGAQVWPYVSIAMGIDRNTIKISIENDGLGPAVLRSATATVDGVREANFIEILHALLGPNLVARRPHGEKIGLSLSAADAGSVLRPGESIEAFALTSKRYALPFLTGYRRITFRICYCAILPGKCWQSNSRSAQDPRPVEACPNDARDLLHAPVADELLNHDY